MKGWEIFWLLVIGLSLLIFTYMSAKILYKGLAELKEMFRNLVNKQNNKNNEDRAGGPGFLQKNS